jgi:hypothetical protein
MHTHPSSSCQGISWCLMPQKRRETEAREGLQEGVPSRQSTSQIRSCSPPSWHVVGIEVTCRNQVLDVLQRLRNATKHRSCSQPRWHVVGCLILCLKHAVYGPALVLQWWYCCPCTASTVELCSSDGGTPHVWSFHIIVSGVIASPNPCTVTHACCCCWCCWSVCNVHLQAMTPLAAASASIACVQSTAACSPSSNSATPCSAQH